MTIHFWPSLQLIAYARVAQGILYSFDLEILKDKFMTRGLSYKNYVSQIEEKVSKIVLPCFADTISRLSVSQTTSEAKYIVLPTEIKKELVGIVISLGVEIKKWFESHAFILQAGYLDLQNKIAWYSFGIIDRFKTARFFIQDETFSIKTRFYLACKYYFEDDVQRLWRNMTENDQVYLSRSLPCSRSMEIWLDALIRSTSIKWEQITLNERRYFFSENYLGMRYYFTKLRGPEMRYMCIFSALSSKSVHHFDMYWCLSQINGVELNALLTCLPASELCEFFQSFLHWPFQIIFLDVANNFKQHINGDIFRDLITSLLFTKLEVESQGNLYVDLLDHFWNPMSADYKTCAKQEELYALVNNVLEYSTFFDMREYMYLIIEYFMQ